ncbi:MAG: hypothetical protein K5745_04185 [Saccharofermentans sp.]|nr:hypothetical protein [Saccharofermentans sp.]
MNKKIMAVVAAGSMLFMTACSEASDASESLIESTSESVVATTATTTTTTTTTETYPTMGIEPEYSFYNGTYECERADVELMIDETGFAYITVTWADSASSEARWTMSGDYDEASNSISYSDCIMSLVNYNDDGQIDHEEELFTDGTGVIQLSDDATLTWQEDVNNQADGMVFTKVNESDNFEEAVGQGDPEHYSLVTDADKETVERTARYYRDAYIAGDWTMLASFVSYPIVISETEIADEAAFIEFMDGRTGSPEDIEAMQEDTCIDMMCNIDGIMIGQGEIWLDGDLKIIAINGLG